MTDSELLRQAQGGDMGAWRSLYARCMPSVWCQALAMVGDHSIAEDIVCETFLALVRGISRLDAGTVHLHSWLQGVVRNKVADCGRHASSQSRLLATVRSGMSQGSDTLRECDAGTVWSPVEAEESRLQVLTVLSQLPELQKLILEWKHIDDLSVRDISERTGQTEKSIESMLYRARKEFRRLYELSNSDKSLTGNDLGHTPVLLKRVCDGRTQSHSTLSVAG